MMEKFHYTFTDKKKITLPKFENALKFGTLRKLRKIEDESEQLFFIVEQVADEKALAVIDEQSMEEFGKMIQAWQEASSLDLSKSESDSPEA